MNRDNSTTDNEVAHAIGRFATAPHNAATANSFRAGKMSARLNNALSAVPVTNPSWTAIVSQPTCDVVNPNCVFNCGPTALPVNHSAIPINSATANTARIRQRVAPCSRSGEISPQLADVEVMRMEAVFRMKERQGLLAGRNFHPNFSERYCGHHWQAE